MSSFLDGFWWSRSVDFRFALIMCWAGVAVVAVGLLVLSKPNLDFVSGVIGYGNMVLAGVVFGWFPHYLKEGKRSGVTKRHG